MKQTESGEEKARKLKMPKEVTIQDLKDGLGGGLKGVLKTRLPYYTKNDLTAKIDLLSDITSMIVLMGYDCGTIFLSPEYLTICIQDTGQREYCDDKLGIDIDRKMGYVDSSWMQINRGSLTAMQVVFETCSSEECERCADVVEGRLEIPYSLELYIGGIPYRVVLGPAEMAFTTLNIIRSWMDGKQFGFKKQNRIQRFFNKILGRSAKFKFEEHPIQLGK